MKKRRKYNQEWYLLNRSEHLEKMKKYYKENSEEKKEYQQRRYLSKKLLRIKKLLGN